MTNFFRDRQFENVENVGIGVQKFIDSKPKELYGQGLDELAKRWLQTIDHDCHTSIIDFMLYSFLINICFSSKNGNFFEST